MNTAHNTNLAYDFSLFDTDEEAGVAKKDEKNKIKMVKTSAARNGNFIVTIFLAACAVIVPVGLLVSKVTLSELTSKINEETILLETERSENARLQALLDNLVSLDKVELYARNELGLQKIQASQEKHIVLNTENMTEIADDEDENIFIQIKNWFSSVLEYLGI